MYISTLHLFRKKKKNYKYKLPFHLLIHSSKNLHSNLLQRRSSFHNHYIYHLTIHLHSDIHLNECKHLYHDVIYFSIHPHNMNYPSISMEALLFFLILIPYIHPYLNHYKKIRAINLKLVSLIDFLLLAYIQ